MNSVAYLLRTTPAIRCISSGASRGWLLKWNDSVDSSPLGPGATLSSTDISNTRIIKKTMSKTKQLSTRWSVAKM